MPPKYHRPETALVASATGAAGKFGLLSAPIFTPFTAFDATPAAACAIARRFGLCPTTAAAIAELAFSHMGAT